jgi:hypothetical protein
MCSSFSGKQQHQQQHVAWHAITGLHQITKLTQIDQEQDCYMYS